MKQIFVSVVVFFILVFQSFAQTTGTLSVSVSTSDTGGNYKPKNIVAIWIEDASGTFVKTLLARADKRKTHLNNWQASTNAAGSEFNTVDAITGATYSSHGTRTCSWNGTNVSGAIVGDGEYRLLMELTDKNATGNYTSFSFQKGPDPVNLNPSSVPSFASVSLNWMPLTSDVSFVDPELNIKIFPNPGSGLFWLSERTEQAFQIRNVEGNVLFSGYGPEIDLRNYPDGIYFLTVTSQTNYFVKKIIKI